MNVHHSLKQQLSDLHESLKTTYELDEEAQQLIKKILEDLENIEASSATVADSHTEDWEAALLQIESQYPNFSHAVKAIVDTLGRMGI